MVFYSYYTKLVKKDFILKDISENFQQVPEIDKLELVRFVGQRDNRKPAFHRV